LDFFEFFVDGNQEDQAEGIGPQIAKAIRPESTPLASDRVCEARSRYP
jgi:hypothetical protein